MTTLLETLSQAITNAEDSQNQIARGAQVAPSQISRLLSGERGLSFESAERIAAFLGYEIILRPKRRTQKAVR